MSFLPEDKITYNELAPSLQNILTKKAEATDLVEHISDMDIHVTQMDRTRIDAIPDPLPNGEKGQVYFVSNAYGNETESGDILKVGEFVNNSTDLESAKSIIVTMQEIFNTWKRFSHDVTTTQPALPAELTSWVYNAETDRISCTANSTSYIGFISAISADSYIHELTISSNSADDDMIGVIIAFAVDKGGREYTLSAIRCANITQPHIAVDESGYRWAIVYNYNRSDQKLISSAEDKIIGGIGNWSTFLAGTKIKIERSKDIIKATTSQMDSTILDPTTELDVDLTSDPVLAIFRGAKQYGYSCLSQPNSTFSNISINLTSGNIYDLYNKSVWISNANGVYSVDTTQSIYSVGIGRLLFNARTKHAFTIDRDLNVIPLPFL